MLLLFPRILPWRTASWEEDYRCQHSTTHDRQERRGWVGAWPEGRHFPSSSCEAVLNPPGCCPEFTFLNSTQSMYWHTAHCRT